MGASGIDRAMARAGSIRKANCFVDICRSIAGQALGTTNQGGNVTFLRRTPWVLFLVLSWAIARLMGANIATSSIPGLFFIVFGVVALVLEFMFSADIAVAAFQRELGMAIVTLVVASVVATCLITLHRGIGFVDGFILCIALVTSWVCPVNSFKTALRSITTDVGITQSPPHEGGK
jgi:hypothetical protein